MNTYDKQYIRDCILNKKSYSSYYKKRNIY